MPNRKAILAAATFLSLFSMVPAVEAQNERTLSEALKRRPGPSASPSIAPRPNTPLAKLSASSSSRPKTAMSRC